MKLLILLGACLFFRGGAAEASAFHYQWKVDDSGYDFNLEMDFAKGVSLAEVIYNLNDVELPKRLNSTMNAAIKIPELGSDYDWITRFKVIGIPFAMKARCHQEEKKAGLELSEWTRKCVLDPEALDSKRFLTRKTDEVKCTNQDHQVHCDLHVTGQIKAMPLMSATTLTLKAKTQGLINWAKFWYFTDQGSISAKEASFMFDRSPLALDIEAGEQEGLKRAKTETPFHFERAGGFTVPEAKE